jgi:hypothetical protein
MPSPVISTAYGSIPLLGDAAEFLRRTGELIPLLSGIAAEIRRDENTAPIAAQEAMPDGVGM